ncbi:hypothetical protein [Streptomyces erythrochromogenes]|uniref:hypothetical protein n=1 Tax=Streptomyces erythrochromogenes TaxID=285574 RepID=UPI0034080E91
MSLLVGSRPWPLLDARMQQLGDHEGTDTAARHLNRLTADTSCQEATGSAAPWSVASWARHAHLPDHHAQRTGRATRHRISVAARFRSTTPAASTPGGPGSGCGPHAVAGRALQGCGDAAGERSRLPARSGLPRALELD